MIPYRLILKSSTRIYRGLIFLYPGSFREEYGDLLLQAFADLSEKAVREAGLAGLLKLWGRLSLDFISSLIKQHLDDGGRKMAKLVIVSGGIYLILLVLFVGGGAYTFRTFYQPPDFHVVSAGQQIDETRALIRFQEAQSGAWGLYRTFLALIGVILAVYLGVWAALFGIWKRSILKGLLALPLGGFLTILSLHPLPWLYFPFDQYPAAAVWVMGAGPLSLAVWFIAALLGRFFTPGSKPLSPA